MCRAATSCLWNAVFVHVQIQLIPNESQGASLLRRCTFGLSRRLFTVLYFSVRSSRSKTLRYKQSAWISIFLNLLSRLPAPIAINPDAWSLGTYETKMVARTGKRSILTMLRRKSITLSGISWGGCGYLLFFRRSVQDFLHILVLAPGQKKKRQNQFFVELHRGRDLRCVSHTRPVTLQTPLEFNACDWIKHCQKTVSLNSFFFAFPKFICSWASSRWRLFNPSEPYS